MNAPTDNRMLREWGGGAGSARIQDLRPAHLHNLSVGQWEARATMGGLGRWRGWFAYSPEGPYSGAQRLAYAGCDGVGMGRGGEGEGN